LYGAIFLACDQDSVDSTPIFQLLLGSAYTKDCSVSYASLSASRLGEDKKLAVGTAGTADPNRPEGYPIPYNLVLNNKSQEGGRSICFPK